VSDFNLKNPYDPNVSLVHSDHPESPVAASDDAKPAVPADSEAIIDRAVESAVVRAVFGHDDIARRRF